MFIFSFLVTGSPIDARNSPIFMHWLIAVAIILGIIALIYFIVKNITKLHNTPEFIEREKNRKCKKSDVKKISKKFNLTSAEVSLLWKVCDISKAKNAIYTTTTNASLQELFFNAYKILTKRNLLTPQWLDAFFTLLYKMEMILVQNKKIPTTRSLPISSIIFYFSNDGEQYPLCVIKNEKDFLSVEIPTFLYTSPKKPNILDKCKFLYKTKDGISYNFTARVIRYEESNDEQILMVIGHTDHFISQPQRHSKRELVDENCYFSPIRINKNKLKTKNMFIYSDKNYQGKLINISVGGCCIQTNLPIRENQHLSVSIPGYKINEKIIGIIKRTRKLATGGYALHIQFTHISLNTKNIIHAIVYKFEL